MYSGLGLSLNEHLLIPSISPTLLNSCKIIDVLYSVDVVSLVSGCHQDPKVTIPITIGTIALRDIQGESSNGVCASCQNVDMRMFVSSFLDFIILKIFYRFFAAPPSYSDSVLYS